MTTPGSLFSTIITENSKRHILGLELVAKSPASPDFGLSPTQKEPRRLYGAGILLFFNDHPSMAMRFFVSTCRASFLWNVQSQDAILEFCLDIFLCQCIAHVETLCIAPA